MAKILIIDDSVISRINLKKILVAEGHEVIGEGCNGSEAITKYEELKPDLMTLDITMPVMDGLEALKKIMSAYPSAKIVMISANDQNRKIMDSLRAGAKNYINKPYEPSQILKVIRDFVG